MLATKQSAAMIEGRLADVRDRKRIFRLMSDFRPDIVFHAAALKHVPLLEQDWGEGVKTNVFGSVNVADAAVAAGAAAMVVISTDKAIEPVSVLGASKRFAEMYCQALDNDFRAAAAARSAVDAIDRGALRQRARLQWLGGAEVQGADRGGRAGHGDASGHGALFHDHPRSLRPRGHGGEPCARAPDMQGVAVYVLNMGQPVKIVDLAERMIRLSGLEPGRDIDIKFTGIRPGERLHEILFAREEPTAPIGIEGIVAAKPVSPSLEAMRGWLAALEQGLAREDRSVIFGVLHDAVPDFSGKAA